MTPLQFRRLSEAKVLTPEPGLERRVLSHSATMMLVEHRMSAGWKGARHRHPQEQLVYVISGRLRFSCGGESFEASAGESFIVPGEAEHEAEALEACVVIDVFSPTRPEYAEASGG